MQYIIFAIAFLIRLIYIIQLKSTIFYDHFLLDEAFYNTWAKSIAGGEWLGKGVFEALPLYPYILGIVYKFFGYNLFLPRLLQITINSFSCVMLYLITKKVFNKRAGIIAGAIACLYAPFIFYTGTICATTFVVFFYLLTSLILLKAIEKPSLPRFFLFGFVVGIATLVRASILLFFPAVLLWLVVILKEKKRALGGSLIATIGLLFVLVPITAINYMASKDIVFLTSHAGINFYIGNNEDADGAFKPPSWARSNIEGLKADSKTIAQRDLGRQLKDSEISRYYFDKTVDFIKKKPALFLTLLRRKLLLIVNKQELYDIGNYQIYREQIPILRFPFITFLIIGPLGLAGLCIALPRWKTAAPLYIFVFTYTVSIILYFVNSRYRIPIASFMIIFSGFLISWFFEKFRQKRYLSFVPTLALCASFYYIVNLPTGIDMRSTAYNNLGNLNMEAGRYNEAARAFHKAIENDATNPKPYNDIGYLYIMQGRLVEGESFLLDSISRDPNYPFAHINLGLLYEKRGEFQAAEREYKEALAINPNIAQAHNNLANIYEATGNRRAAILEYKKAIELDPSNGRTHYNLGIMYGRDRRLDEAKKEFERAIELDPGFSPAQKALRYWDE